MASQWEVTAVRYATRETTKSECYLGFAMYGEPDEAYRMDYFFYVLTDGRRTVLVDTGYSAAAGARRGRTTLVAPLDALRRLGVDPATVTQVVITHFHYDHVGNIDAFPAADILVPRRELEFWTGTLAARQHFAAHVEAEEIERIADAHLLGRVRCLESGDEVAPGVRVLHVGGHCPGQMVVVVDGGDGPIVLASDAVHYYEELELDRPFAIVVDLEEQYAGYELVRELAQSPGARLLAGHDPAVLDRFPQVADAEGILGVRIPRGNMA